MPRLILASVLFLATNLPAFAFDASDRNTILQEAAGFERAVQHKNYDVFFDTVPPRMMRALAAQSHLGVDALESQMETQIDKAMAPVVIDSFDMDVSAMQSGHTKAGRAFATIPTISVIEIPGRGTLRRTDTTLALQDNAEWYLIRLDSPAQLALLRKTYPDFRAITFPKDTEEALQ
ncbi:hypothetical protein [Thioclava indica]|uniref:Uncharacterized protein n=1 Tax=Thioclava indica TaxID=1353528 RepID=A0A074JPM9_9RHOB|nr:hypothetical protein [Thioclava indica]KEO57563.1 hypothetical protein DT23_05685 [Thioclava indica]